MNLDGPAFAFLLVALFIGPAAMWTIWALRSHAMHQPVLTWHAHTVSTIVYYAVLLILYAIVFSSPTETPATTAGCLWLIGGVVLVIWNLSAALVVRPPDGIPRCNECGYILRGLRESRCPECGREFQGPRESK